MKVRRLLVVPLAFLLLATSCVFGGSKSGAADELEALAARVETATYAAVYRFAFTRQFAPGITTRMEITQDPPVTVRKVDTTTKPATGKAVTLTTWYIHNAGGNYVCNRYAQVGTRCSKTALARTSFGSEKLDVFFDAPRTAGSFGSVRKGSRPERIQGHQGTCFEAVPAAPSPEAASSEPTDERFRFELCYSEDGILLRGKRTTLDDSGAAANAESFVEIISLSRVVEPRELRLPGEIVEPGDLPG
jgi:hypothetical protein